jgi:hypothetical protein
MKTTDEIAAMARDVAGRCAVIARQDRFRGPGTTTQLAIALRDEIAAALSEMQAKETAGAKKPTCSVCCRYDEFCECPGEQPAPATDEPADAVERACESWERVADEADCSFDEHRYYLFRMDENDVESLRTVIAAARRAQELTVLLESAEAERDQNERFAYAICDGGAVQAAFDALTKRAEQAEHALAEAQRALREIAALQSAPNTLHAKGISQGIFMCAVIARAALAGETEASDD